MKAVGKGTLRWSSRQTSTKGKTMNNNKDTTTLVKHDKKGQKTSTNKGSDVKAKTVRGNDDKSKKKEPLYDIRIIGKEDVLETVFVSEIEPTISSLMEEFGSLSEADFVISPQVCIFADVVVIAEIITNLLYIEYKILDQN